MEAPRTIKDLVESFAESTGEAGRLYATYRVIKRMLNDPDCYKFLSFTEYLVMDPTALRAIVYYIEKGGADAIMTTAQAVEIEVARAFGSKELATLSNRQGVIRLLGEALKDLETGAKLGPSTLLERIGSVLAEKGQTGFLAAAYRKHVPVFAPDLANGVLAYCLIEGAREGLIPHVAIDILEDEVKLANIVFEHKKLGAVFLAGGLAKHHVQWWSSFRGGLDYAVQIVTVREYDGSLTGARLEESITWHQLKPEGDKVSVVGDPALLFPLLAYSLL